MERCPSRLIFHCGAAETDAQLHALKSALRPVGSQGPKVSLYHLDEFID
jgi:hypothetical protein